MSLYSEEAEKSVIGCMVISEKQADVVLKMLTPEDFLLDRYRILFEAIKSLRASNKPCDLVTIRDRLNVKPRSTAEQRLIDSCVDAVDYMASPANAPYYAEIIKKCAWKRRTQKNLQALLGELEQGDAEELAVKVKGLADDWHSASSPALMSLDTIDVEDDEEGVLTGYGPAVDNLTRVGWVNGQVSVVSAYHKGGKTTFMIGSFAHCAKRGVRAVYATFADLSPKQLKRRLLKQECGAGGYPTTRVDMIPDYLDALGEMDDPMGDWASARFYSAAQHGREVETFSAKMLTAHAQEPIGIVFADYAQKIGAREVKASEPTRRLEYVSDVLSELAEKLGCPIVLGSQVTKDGNGGYVTKYARALEEDAGFVLQVMREEDDKAKVVCAYNRFGPQNVEVPMRWNDRKVKFEAYAITHVSTGK